MLFVLTNTYSDWEYTLKKYIYKRHKNVHRYFRICTDEHLLRMLAVVAVCHVLFVIVQERSCFEVVFLLCMLVGWVFFVDVLLVSFCSCSCFVCLAFGSGGWGVGVGSMHVCVRVCVCVRERERMHTCVCTCL